MMENQSEQQMKMKWKLRLYGGVLYLGIILLGIFLTKEWRVRLDETLKGVCMPHPIP